MSNSPDPWATAGAPAADPWAAGSDPWANTPTTTDHPLPTGRGYSPSVTVADDPEHIDLASQGYGYKSAFAMGLADSATFGFDDEIWAGLKSLGGSSYADNLRHNRAMKDAYGEQYGKTYFAGQIVGGFIPITGWAGRAKMAVGAAEVGGSFLLRAAAKDAVKVGAAQGLVYGAGSSQAEDIFDYTRVRDAAVGSILGAAGGFVLGSTIIPAGKFIAEKAVNIMKRGAIPKLDFKFKLPSQAFDEAVAADVKDARLAYAKANPAAKAEKAAEGNAAKAAPEVGAVAPKAEPKSFNPLTGKADDVLEEGAVFTTKDLTEGGLAAKKTILDRIATLTPQQAKVASQKLEKAMASGDLAKDPHFRSILGLDLDKVATGDEIDAAFKAASVFEEMTSALLERAGMGKKTQAGMEMELRKQFGGGVTETELDRLVAAQSDANGAANIGSTMMALSGLQFARATKELLPLVLKGEQAAREQLTEVMTKAIRISAKGRFLVSSAGRNLGMLSKDRMLAFTQVVGDRMEVESAESIRARIQQSLEKLGDEQLGEMLTRVRDLSDLENVQKMLLDSTSAESLGLFMRARNTAGLWLKSNTLTPMSGVVNVVGFMLHDMFRNDWARSFAAHVAREAGRVDEAQILSFQNQVRKSVHWAAHGEGLSSALQRVKWEWLDSVSKIAGVAGFKNRSLKASAAKIEMLQKGYNPPALREQDFEQGLAITDVGKFNDKLAARAEDGGALALLVNALERTYATGINTVDALATSTGRVVSGVLDDWGRAFVRTKEVYAQSAAYATREAIDAGLKEKDLIDYVSKRTAELAEMPPAEILAEVERKLVNGEDLNSLDKHMLRRDWEAEREAEKVLFIDGPQTAGGRLAARAAGALDKLAGGFVLPGVLMTYIRTPTRIFERGLVSYTPWGAASEEVQTILAKGGIEAAVEKARMDLGAMVMGLGMMGAASGAITITNGGFQNSKNLEGAPANRLNLPGGGYVELGRLDPFSLTLALGGIIGQAWKDGANTDDEHGRDEAIRAAMSTAFLSVREAILEKSYMTSARDLMKAMFGSDYDTAAEGYAKILQSTLTRLVPLAGVSRQVNETIAGRGVEAATFMDQLFKVTPGMGAYLPAKYDALGNEVNGRFMGLAAGFKNGDEITKRVAALGIDLTNLRQADPTGFDLTSGELSELRRIRGNEATNRDGMTLKEALGALLDDPSFQQLETKDERQKAVSDVISDFNEPARRIFEEQNQDYLAAREGNRSFKKYLSDGLTRHAAAESARSDLARYGLPDTNRLPE